jgi:pimeloyl-ACP methyl ester carboxylesterase
MRSMVERGRRSEAVKTFLRTVGAPAAMVAVMRLTPVWKRLTGVAHTLPYDLALVIDLQQGRPIPDGTYDAVAQPTLVIAGGKSPAYLRNAQVAVAEAVPDARLETLPGQTHMIRAKATAPVVAAHLLG